MRYVYLVEKEYFKNWGSVTKSHHISVYGSKKRAIAAYEEIKEEVRKRAEINEFTIHYNDNPDPLLAFFYTCSENGDEGERVSIGKEKLK